MSNFTKGEVAVGLFTVAYILCILAIAVPIWVHMYHVVVDFWWAP